jgi:hypothetical protein
VFCFAVCCFFSRQLADFHAKKKACMSAEEALQQFSEDVCGLTALQDAIKASLSALCFVKESEATCAELLARVLAVARALAMKKKVFYLHRRGAHAGFFYFFGSKRGLVSLPPLTTFPMVHAPGHRDLSN